jgi:caa(3)-type oxidase subunit IV
MGTLVRTNATAVWLILCALTITSWALGTRHVFGVTDHIWASVVIIVVAVFKVRLVGLYFMELKDAPLLLRGFFEVYCAALMVVLNAMLLSG